MPAIIVATKADQVPRGRRRAAQDQVAATLDLADCESVVFVSSQTGEGRPLLWARIDEAFAGERRE